MAKKEYEVGEFYHVCYYGDWTIAMFIEKDKDTEDEGAFNKWLRFGAGLWSNQREFDEIDPTPIKRKENE